MSGEIRTQIGNFKSRLLHRFDKDGPLMFPEEFKSFDIESAIVAIKDIQEDEDGIQSIVRKLFAYEQKWISLRKDDPAEKDEHAAYCKKYGDYMETFKKGVDRLQALHNLYRVGYERVKALDVTRTVGLVTPETVGLVTH
ncbi:hypothetical protein CRE_27447 [Caenorhabditis remanei]|uniref:Uncharacterized protein n=1 Tax=Caenorhabditis remanei TaxID=31234 RepID=E3LNN3_CAERE|nr:hypothetical protein CRE_27447 [Caenorhabditis remanei]